jgi:biopolymer transport protein ExbD
MDVSPLVDILLVLGMVFGILAYPYAHRFTIDARVSPPPGVDGISVEAVIVVAAANARVLLVDRHPVEPAMLRGRAVIVEADSGVVYQDVVHAVDIAIGAGARVVQLDP